jgi:uncharacterized protein
MAMTGFTPLQSLAGGMLIGAAAVMLMAVHGRIAGISRITARLLPPWTDQDTPIRFGFVAGLILAPLAIGLATGEPVVQTVNSNSMVMAVSGLLVGFGSVLGSGCTSGHGVCGLARLSSRSLVATMIFMAVVAGTVYVVRHLIGG